MNMEITIKNAIKKLTEKSMFKILELRYDEKSFGNIYWSGLL